MVKPGCRSYRGKLKSGSSPKKAHFMKIRPFNASYFQRSHAGLMKRIKVVGPKWNRQFRFKSPNKSHLNLKRTRNNLKRKNRKRYISKPDQKRIRRLLPYYKRQNWKRMQ